MSQTLDELMMQLVDQVLEIPNALSANLETGSHDRNNAEAERWNAENRILLDHLVGVMTLAGCIEDRLLGEDHAQD